MGAFIRKDAAGFLTKETEHGNSFNYYDEEQDPPVIVQAIYRADRQQFL